MTPSPTTAPSITTPDLLTYFRFIAALAQALGLPPLSFGANGPAAPTSGKQPASLDASAFGPVPTSAPTNSVNGTTGAAGADASTSAAPAAENAAIAAGDQALTSAGGYSGMGPEGASSSGMLAGAGSKIIQWAEALGLTTPSGGFNWAGLLSAAAQGLSAVKPLDAGSAPRAPAAPGGGGPPIKAPAFQPSPTITIPPAILLAILGRGLGMGG